jgi:hypothetical protein
MLAVVTLVLLPVVLLMKRSMAEKSAQIGHRAKYVCVLAEQKGKLLDQGSFGSRSLASAAEDC